MRSVLIPHTASCIPAGNEQYRNTRLIIMIHARQRMMRLAALALLVMALPAGIASAQQAGDITYQAAAFDAAKGETTPLTEIGMSFFLADGLVPVQSDEPGIIVGSYASTADDTLLRVTRMPAVTGTGEHIRSLRDLALMYDALGMEDVQEVRINGVPALTYSHGAPSTLGVVFLKGRTLVEFTLSSPGGKDSVKDYARLLVQSIAPLPAKAAPVPAPTAVQEETTALPASPTNLP